MNRLLASAAWAALLACVPGMGAMGAEARAQEPFAQNGSAPTAIVTELKRAVTTDAGQAITLPQGNVTVVASTYEIPVGASLPVHKHPSARYAYVLSGTLRVTHTDTGETSDYKAGDFIIEMIDAWHSGTNTGTEAVRLLVIDQVPEGGVVTVGGVSPSHTELTPF